MRKRVQVATEDRQVSRPPEPPEIPIVRTPAPAGNPFPASCELSGRS